MRLILLAALATIVHANDARREAHGEVYGLTELARAAPAEFAADGLLRLLEADAIPGSDWRLELAHEALGLAGAVRHPVRKRLAPGLRGIDSRAGLLNTAYAHGLDALTLSLRAIEQIRRVDTVAARKAFERIPRPAPATATCKDALLDDISGWYQMAGRLQMDPLPMIQTIRTHGEIAPAIDLLFAAGALDVHVGALAQKLQELPGEDRPFNAALFDTPQKLRHLVRVLEAQQRPAVALADGWRTWMRSGLAATACQESRNPGAQEQARRDGFTLFNDTLSPPLDAELLKPTGAGEPAALEPFANSETIQEQTRRFHQLLFGGQGRALSSKEKDTAEWREQMQQYIRSIESRTRTADESDAEYFYRQSQLWAGVLMAATPGTVRDRALQQFLSFLLLHAGRVDPAVWFSQVEALAGIARSLHGGDFASTLQALHGTAHPVLRLYAALETAYPRPPMSSAH